MPDNDPDSPVLRKEHPTDKFGPKLVNEADKLQQKYTGRAGTGTSEKKGPAGGYDDTPVPHAPPGYTLKITFHKAENLPFADLGTLSSDPYILAILKSDLPKRHKQDPDLSLRTPTIHRSTSPEWNTDWIVANVPKSGFYLKCRLYDEDPSDHDDRLGNVHINISNIDDNWEGFSRQSFELKKRMGSKRAYTFRGCAALFSRNIKMDGHLVVSVENLGRTKDEDGGRMYTVGPLAWSRHYSPLIGRLAGTKNTETSKDGKETQKYKYAYQPLWFMSAHVVYAVSVSNAQVPVSKPSKCNSAALSPRTCTTDTLNLSPSSLGCSRRTPCAGGCSIARCIISTPGSTTTTGPPSTGLLQSRTST